MNDYTIVHRNGSSVIVWPDGTTMPAIGGGANDLLGLVTSLSESFDLARKDRALVNNEEAQQLIRILSGLIKARCTANGVTGYTG